jgi:hypothetical protein
MKIESRQTHGRTGLKLYNSRALGFPDPASRVEEFAREQIGNEAQIPEILHRPGVMNRRLRAKRSLRRFNAVGAPEHRHVAMGAVH